MKHWILAASLFLAACQTTQAPPVTLKSIRDISGLVGEVPKPRNVQLLASQFRNMAFSDELGKYTDYVVKWDASKQIGVCLDRSMRRTHTEKLADAERLLTEITGLRFDGSGCDVSVIRSNAPRQSDSVGYCYADTTLFIETGIIFEAKVYIPDHQALDGDCLIEELAQMLGLAADSSLVTASLFQENDQLRTVKTLTYSDAVQLRTLYDPRIRPRMPKAETVRIVPVIIAEHLAELNR